MTLVPDGFSASQNHTYRFSRTRPGSLFVRIRRGTPSFGGYLLNKDFTAVLKIPQPDPKVQILPDGGLLSLSGERSITIAARGTRKIGIQVARLLPGTFQHLITQSDGNLRNPTFRNYDFTSENITTVFGSTLDIASDNDFSPVAIDVSLDALFKKLAEEESQPTEAVPTVASRDTNRPRFIPVRGVRGAVSGSIPPESITRSSGAPPATGVFFLRVFDSTPNPHNLEPELENVGQNSWWEEEDHSNLVYVYDEETGTGKYVKRPAAVSRLLTITDTGIIAKENADGTRDIFVQSLSSGRPVAGAEAALLAKNGTVLARTTTDNSGRATFRDTTAFAREREPVAYIVTRGTDTSFLPYSSWDRRLDFSRFDVDGAFSDPLLNLDAFVFTERGIFRPGEDVRFGIALRRLDWSGDLDGIPLRVRIANSNNDVLYESTHAMDRSGLIEVNAPTQTTSRSGPYRITVSVPRSEKESTPIGSTIFMLQDFQPDTLRVKTQVLPKDPQGLPKAEDLALAVVLENLYGGHPEGRRVTARANVRPATMRLDQYPGFIFGYGVSTAEPQFNAWEFTDLNETVSDQDGYAEFSLSELPTQAGRLAAVRVNVEAFEADGGRSVPAQQTILFAQTDKILGVFPPRNMNFLDQNQPAEIQLRAIQPDYSPTALPGLTLTIVEQRTFYTLRRRAGYYYYDNFVREIPVQKINFDISEEPLAHQLKTDQPGQFKVTITDAAGVELTSFNYNVSGWSEHTGGAALRESELALTLDKDSYEPGETMRISLQSAFPGPGLITIESDRVLHHQWFVADSVNSVQSMSIPPGITGQVYINVALSRAPGDSNIRFSPLAYAVKPVTIGRQSRSLPVTITTVERCLPGEAISIRVSSPEAARAIIFAVDEGILNITNYRTPNPLEYAFRKFALQTGTLQTLDLVLPEASLFRRLAAAGGNGDDYDEELLDANLNPFARRLPQNAIYWSGPREIGPEPIELLYTPPDAFSGTLRVMAVAVTPSRLSDGPSREILVRGPVVVEPNIPVFATPGDVLDLSVTLNRDPSAPPAGPAPVALSLEQSGHFEILEPLPSSITLSPGQETTVPFRVRVRNALGPAEVTLLATLGTDTITATSTLSVRPPTPRVTRFAAAKHTTNDFTLDFPEPMHAAFADTRVSISTTPLGLADGLRRYLEHYPYGCTEQITSAAFCRLLIGDDGQPALPSELLQKQLTHTFTQLASRQNSNGGIGFWYADNFEGLDFFSPHVAMLCLEARETGLEVPENFERSLLEYIRRMTARQPENLWELRNLAFMLYIRARHGDQVTSHILNAQDIIEKSYKKYLPTDIFTPLLAAAHKILHNDAAANSLMDQFSIGRNDIPAGQTYTYWGDYYHPIARDSIYLTMLARHFPERLSKLNPDWVDVLIRPITEGDVNTSGAAFATLALRALAAAAQSQTDVQLNLTASTPNGEVPLPATSGIVRTASLPHDIQRLRVQISGALASPLLYTQTFQTGFPLSPMEKPEHNGIRVTRRITNSPDPEQPGDVVDNAKIGDDLYVHLTLQSTTEYERGNIAIVDLLPAGFEVPRTDLSSGPSDVAGVDYIELREDRVIIYCRAPAKGVDYNRSPLPPLRFTYRIKPTTIGQLQVPPIYAESMYDARITSLGEPSTFTVMPR